MHGGPDTQAQDGLVHPGLQRQTASTHISCPLHCSGHRMSSSQVVPPQPNRHPVSRRIVRSRSRSRNRSRSRSRNRSSTAAARPIGQATPANGTCPFRCAMAHTNHVAFAAIEARRITEFTCARASCKPRIADTEIRGAVRPAMDTLRACHTCTALAGPSAMAATRAGPGIAAAVGPAIRTQKPAARGKRDYCHAEPRSLRVCRNPPVKGRS
jgi:hypothetical protein